MNRNGLDVQRPCGRREPGARGRGERLTGPAGGAGGGMGAPGGCGRIRPSRHGERGWESRADLVSGMRTFISLRRSLLWAFLQIRQYMIFCSWLLSLSTMFNYDYFSRLVMRSGRLPERLPGARLESWFPMDSEPSCSQVPGELAHCPWDPHNCLEEVSRHPCCSCLLGGPSPVPSSVSCSPCLSPLL